MKGETFRTGKIHAGQAGRWRVTGTATHHSAPSTRCVTSATPTVHEENARDTPQWVAWRAPIVANAARVGRKSLLPHRPSIAQMPADAERPFLISWGESRMALAATRALGQAGVATAVLAEHAWAPAWASRWCNECVHAPDADTVTPYIERLEELARSGRYAGLFICDDRTAKHAGRHRERLVNLPMLLPDQPWIELATDKSAMMQFAQQHSIPIPQTASPCTVGDVDRSVRGLRYPLVVKGSGGWASSQLRVVHDAMALHTAFHDMMPAAGSGNDSDLPHIQEWVKGPVYSVLALCDRGDAIALFQMRKHLTYPVWGGPCVDATSVDHPGLRSAALRLLEHLPWHGVIEIEFILDERDGRFLLVEPSPDPNWGLDLAVSCGFNLPLLACRLMQGDRKGAAQHDYKVGQRHVWLLPEGVLHMRARPRNAKHLLGAALSPGTTSDVLTHDWRPLLRQLRQTIWAWRSNTREAPV